MDIGTTIGNLKDGPLSGQFGALAARGIRSVEVWFGDDAVLAQEEGFLEQVGSRCEKADVYVWSVHTSFGREFDISSEDKRIRERGIQDAMLCARGLRRMGGTQVILHASAPLAEGGRDRQERLAWSMESLAEIIEACAREDVQLALENELPNHLGDRAAELLYILDRFPSLGICLDTGHAHIAGEGAGLIEQVGHRISAVHLHDNRGVEDEHVLPGFGTIDWGVYGEALARSAYRGPLMFEAGGPGSYEEVLNRMASVGQWLQEKWIL